MTRDTFKPVRHGNISLELRHSCLTDPDRTDYEILHYYPNPYYKREKDFVFDKDGEWAHSKKDPAHYHVHRDCFKREQSCYVVAFLEWNSAGDEFDIRSVGSRAFRLNAKDARDLRKVIADIERYEGEEE